MVVSVVVAIVTARGRRMKQAWCEAVESQTGQFRKGYLWSKEQEGGIRRKEDHKLNSSIKDKQTERGSAPARREGGETVSYVAGEEESWPATWNARLNEKEGTNSENTNDDPGSIEGKLLAQCDHGDGASSARHRTSYVHGGRPPPTPALIRSTDEGGKGARRGIGPRSGEESENVLLCGWVVVGVDAQLLGFVWRDGSLGWATAVSLAADRTVTGARLDEWTKGTSCEWLLVPTTPVSRV